MSTLIPRFSSYPPSSRIAPVLYQDRHRFELSRQRTYGGVGVKVDTNTGRLGARASDGRGRIYNFKPEAHDSLEDVVLPDWEEALAIARRVQKCFAPFNRFIGMDIGFSESGPVLVEVNDGFDCGRFESVTGPILKNEAVLDCCKRYGMLTHRRLG